MNRPSEILKRTAHFLCINSEALPSNGFDGKIPLLYFLFAYGKRFDKQHYTDFAFEILQECLSEALRKLQSSEDLSNDGDLTALELGWSLQKFVDMGFFESDEMNEILMPFDTMAVHCAEQSIKNVPSKDTIDEFFFLATYLNDRVSAFAINSAEIGIAKAYLIKIINSIENFLDTNDAEILEAVGVFEILNYEKLNKMRKKNFLNEKKILERFENARDINDLRASLYLYLYLPETFKGNAHTAYSLWNTLIEATKSAMKSVYIDNQKNAFGQLLAVQMYGSALLENRGAVHRQFLAYTLLNRAHNHWYIPKI